MHRLLALAIAALLSVTTAALADDAAPWVADEALARNVMSEVGTSGIQSVQSHLDELEAALSRAKTAIDAAHATHPTRVVLTDGPAQTLAGMLLATADKETDVKESVAVPNPYPQIGLVLGSYYDEVGRPADALRALDAAIASDLLIGIPGEMTPDLKGERAIALIGLKRLDDALASYDDALADDQLPADTRAHLLRGRGYVLTELGRIDDAQKAYEDSLALEPGNASAQHELQYLAKLRAGAARTQGGIKPLQPPAQRESPPRSDH